jgi:outer membrane protein TolC
LAAIGGVPLSLLQAVTTTLRRHPALVSARAAVEVARGDAMSAAGQFDTTVRAGLGHQRAIAPAFDLDTGRELPTRTDATDLSLGASKTLHFGTVIAADAGVTRSDLHGALPSFIQTGNVGLSVTQPLLRGAGQVGAASTLRSLELQEEASEDSLSFVAQQQAFAAILAYWDLVASEQELQLFEVSVKRAERILDETRVLVEHDQRPRGDLRSLEAGLATRKRDVLATRSARLRAIHALQLAMGLNERERAEWHPTDGFPAPGLPAASIDALWQRAEHARFDVRAARSSLRAAAAAARGAEHNTLAKVDVTLSVGYAGGVLRDGVPAYFDALARPQGVNAGASVTVEWPVENNTQRGERVRAAGQRMAAETALSEISRTLRNSVSSAYDDLRYAVDALREAQRAEVLYDQALSDERYKLRAGLSTVIDVVLTEELLTDATRARIETERSLADALARLRFELGSLPSESTRAPQAIVAVLNAGVL